MCNPGWTMCVKGITSYHPFPIFEWRYDCLHVRVSGGELLTQMASCTFFFKKDGIRGGQHNKWKFSSIEEAMGKINQYGWVRPPFIDEVFQIMLFARDNLPKENGSERRIFLAGIQEKLEILISGGSKSQGAGVAPDHSAGVLVSPHPLQPKNGKRLYFG